MKKKVYKICFVLIIVIFPFFIICCGNSKTAEETILKNENEALKRWGNRDVWGYLELYTEDATYYDPNTKIKLNGFKEIKSFILPLNGKVYIPSYKMVNIDINVYGQMGVLTYNVFNFNEKGDTLELWNSTEIYKKVNDNWKILHSHWSIAKRNF